MSKFIQIATPLVAIIALAFSTISAIFPIIGAILCVYCFCDALLTTYAYKTEPSNLRNACQLAGRDYNPNALIGQPLFLSLASGLAVLVGPIIPVGIAFYAVFRTIAIPRAVDQYAPRNITPLTKLPLKK